MPRPRHLTASFGLSAQSDAHGPRPGRAQARNASSSQADQGGQRPSGTCAGEAPGACPTSPESLGHILPSRAPSAGGCAIGPAHAHATKAAPGGFGARLRAASSPPAPHAEAGRGWTRPDAGTPGASGRLPPSDASLTAETPGGAEAQPPPPPPGCKRAKTGRRVSPDQPSRTRADASMESRDQGTSQPRGNSPGSATSTG